MSTAKVFVGSLPPGCKPEELRRLFTNYGVVVECDIMNRCGFVHMETIEMAEAAISSLNGIDFKGQQIVVEPGRPKDRRGGGGGVGGGGNAGNRRPMQGHGGGNFNRGCHSGGNNFRGAGGGGGGNRQSNSNGSQFGPMRNEGHFRQQRSAPYNKGLPQHNQSYDGSSQPFKNKFNQGTSQIGHNDYYVGNMGPAGSGGSQRNPGPVSSIGQDRRGFALPAVDHQQPQSVPYGPKQNRFANSPMVSSGSNTDGGMYPRHRSNNAMNNSGPTYDRGGGGGRGGFSANRGGFISRGGFNGRRGGGNGPNSSMPHTANKRGPANGHSHNHSAANAYHSEFPPLGSHSSGLPGNRNRFNGNRPVQNMSGNRRF